MKRLSRKNRNPMKRNSRRLFLLLLVLCAFVPQRLWAQRAFDVITGDRNLSASNFSIYREPTAPLTPPPPGKRPTSTATQTSSPSADSRIRWTPSSFCRPRAPSSVRSRLWVTCSALPSVPKRRTRNASTTSRHTWASN